MNFSTEKSTCLWCFARIISCILFITFFGSNEILTFRISQSKNASGLNMVVQISPTAVASAETLGASSFSSAMDISGDGSDFSVGDIQDPMPLTPVNTLIVSTNPQEGDYTSIQEAIEAASPGDIIEVKAGIYRENLTIGKSLEIRSESNDSRDVIISADNNQPVVIAIPPAATVKLSGLSLYNSKNVSTPWVQIGAVAKYELVDVCIGWNFDGEIPLLEDSENGNMNQITDWLPKGIKWK